MHNRPSNKLEVILFDLGNTLLYFDGVWEQVIPAMDTALFNFLHKAGFQLDKQDFLRQLEARFNEYDSQKPGEYLEFPTTFILQSLLTDLGYPNIPEATLHLAAQEMYKVSQAYWLPEADAQPALKTLRDRGYRLGLISNAGDDQDVQTLVDKANLRNYFDVILTSAAQGIRKPNPQIFYRALLHWGIPPERSAMVGDTLGADILGAQNAGIYSVWITRRASHQQALWDTIKPNARVEALSELPALFASI